nr:hypothetical protein [uncultured Roseovarius sp.]
MIMLKESTAHSDADAAEDSTTITRQAILLSRSANYASMARVIALVIWTQRAPGPAQSLSWFENRSETEAANHSFGLRQCF